MYGLNKVQLIGRLGKDPELKYTANSVPVCNFSLATNENYKDSSGTLIERTEWHNIVVYRKIAEVLAQYAHKGDLIYLEGKLQTRNWEKDGVKHYMTEIIVSEFVFLNSKSGESRPTSAPDGPAESGRDEPILPF